MVAVVVVVVVVVIVGVVGDVGMEDGSSVGLLVLGLLAVAEI